MSKEAERTMKGISFLLGRRASEQLERELKMTKWTLERDRVELLLGDMTPQERFEYACYVFDIDE